jgi:hypothetical protein
MPESIGFPAAAAKASIPELSQGRFLSRVEVMSL